DVIEGLQEAHRLEVIHRDVKPSNCFLEPDGRVKVGDFGLAKSLVKAAHLTRTGAFVGTPHYASSEQIRGEPIDRRTDVYSVAARGRLPDRPGPAGARRRGRVGPADRRPPRPRHGSAPRFRALPKPRDRARAPVHLFRRERARLGLLAGQGADAASRLYHALD